MEIDIRKIEKRDIAKCLEIYNYYVVNTNISFEEEALSLEKFETRVENITKSYPYIVACEGERVVGYAYLDRFHERSAYRYTADLSIYVDKNFSGCGIGGKLLCEIERLGRESGIINIISLIVADNAPSIAFHKKHGFFECGTMESVGLKFGKWHSIKYFQKRIK